MSNYLDQVKNTSKQCFFIEEMLQNSDDFNFERVKGKIYDRFGSKYQNKKCEIALRVRILEQPCNYKQVVVCAMDVSNKQT